MSRQKSVEKMMRTIFKRWFPVIFTLLIIFLFPPIAIAIIVAYFTAPLLLAVHQTTKLPFTIATLIVMLLLASISVAVVYIGLYGIVEAIPTIERHLAPFTNETNFVGKILTFLEVKVVEYGHALIEYAFAFLQTLFQQLMSLFIFLIGYFFALRESGKNRFWFLIYFPSKLRKQAKHTLMEASKLIGTFIYVEARLLFITFIILSIGFFFINFTTPIGIALLISFADSLPFLGIGVFLIPMITFFFYTGDFFTGISLVLIYICTMIIRQFAESYMWASTFELKPIHAFFIMACSVYLFGIIGILLTPFLLFAALKVKQHPLFNE